MRLEWITVGEGRQKLVDMDKVSVRGSRGPFVRQERLSPRARRALKIQLGRDFESESSLRAYMKDKDLRFLDNGEPAEKARKLRKEWMRETKPGDRGRNPAAKSRGYSHW